MRRRSLLAVAIVLAGCGSSGQAGGDEDQIKEVARTAAEAVATRDAAKLCEVLDTTKLDEGASCEDLAQQALFDDQSAEEKADAESFEVISVKIDGDEATAQVRTHNDEADATFRKVDGEWKFVGSPALE